MSNRVALSAILGSLGIAGLAYYLAKSRRRGSTGGLGAVKWTDPTQKDKFVRHIAAYMYHAPSDLSVRERAPSLDRRLEYAAFFVDELGKRIKGDKLPDFEPYAIFVEPARVNDPDRPKRSLVRAAKKMAKNANWVADYDATPGDTNAYSRARFKNIMRSVSRANLEKAESLIPSLISFWKQHIPGDDLKNSVYAWFMDNTDGGGEYADNLVGAVEEMIRTPIEAFTLPGGSLSERRANYAYTKRFGIDRETLVRAKDFCVNIAPLHECVHAVADKYFKDLPYEQARRMARVATGLCEGDSQCDALERQRFLRSNNQRFAEWYRYAMTLLKERMAEKGATGAAERRAYKLARSPEFVDALLNLHPVELTRLIAYANVLGLIRVGYKSELHTSDLRDGASLVRYLVRKVKARAADSKTDDSATLRSKDRLAQRDPEWAIEQCRVAYETGESFGPKIRPALDFLKLRAKQGETIFVHGRDGELVAELLRREGYKTAYGVTSRTITTEHAKHLSPEQIKDTQEYFKKVVPGSAIHFDTGYSGSVPKWFAKQGFDVKQIWMLSSRHPEYQIPGMDNSQHFRDSLVERVEHGEMKRLEDVWPRISSKSLPFAYSKKPQCFWAAVYGAADALGLPRKVDKSVKVVDYAKLKEKMSVRRDPRQPQNVPRWRAKKRQEWDR